MLQTNKHEHFNNEMKLIQQNDDVNEGAKKINSKNLMRSYFWKKMKCENIDGKIYEMWE